MFRKKIRQLCLGGQGKDRVALIKSLINARVWKRRFDGRTIKDRSK
jgi:hypothetical protein